ncbi:hypothetical protein NQD34_012488 [Periophthalmus magnuspinnatus]|uniref:uncharacterized protein LOC117383999 n=1 Tax=Periophthalmus magnuspinnatus TaxID=409849 RepID=UPI00145AC75F|nr:uncharacterized protein LOC117383999 [Periophthalmus magnuspinnatus]KAJ0000646.1 hypothetical protein NQD34_012488 [Periophthalmus magnuspinnatus]
MASSSITKLGGVIVVTQVIPQDEKNGVALKDTPSPDPATPTDAQAPPTSTEVPQSTLKKMDKMTAEFLLGEPIIMGVFQLFLGLVCVLFGLTATFHRILLFHAPVCSSVIFVVAGCVTLVAAKSTTPFLVHLTAGWSMLSCLLSIGGVAYLSWLLSWPRPSEQLCNEFEYKECVEKHFMRLDTLVLGLQILFLVLLVMELIFSIIVSTFSIKASRQRRLQVLSESDSEESLLQSE